MLQLFSSKTFWKRFAVWFFVTFISHGFLTYAFHDKAGPFFTLEIIGGVAIFSLWMAYSFAALSLINAKNKNYLPNNILTGNFNFYFRFFFINAIIFSAILIVVLSISYFVLELSTNNSIAFFAPVSKAVLVLVCMIFILTLLKYLYHRLQHR